MHVVTASILRVRILRVSPNRLRSLVTESRLIHNYLLYGVDVQEIIDRKATVLNLSKDPRNPQPSKDDIKNADRVFQYALHMLHLEECVPIERALSEIPGESFLDWIFNDVIVETVVVNVKEKITVRRRESKVSGRRIDIKA